MALPTNLDTLDYAFAGLPFMRWGSSALADTTTLDYAQAGLPFYTQFDTQAIEPAVITISAGAPEINMIQRKFPNKRQEMVSETQIKHAIPVFNAQYVLHLP